VSRWRHPAGVVLFFAVVTAFYTHPLPLQPGTTLMAGLGDYVTEATMVAWNARQIARDPRRLPDLPFYYPYANAVAYQQSFVFPGLLAAPVIMLTDQPLLATNLLLLLALVLSGTLMHFLAFALTGRVLPSLLAGAVFAYYPNRMDHIGQFTYQMAVLYPVVLGAVYRFWLGGRWRDLLLAGAAMWAQALSSLYNAYALGLLLVGLTVGLWLLRPRLLTAARAAKAVAGLALLAIALSPFLAPYLTVHRELGFQRDVATAEWFGMDALSILDPGTFNRLYAGRLLRFERSEGGLFPGLVAFGLVGVALVLAGRRDRADGLPRWARRARWGLLALALGCLAVIAAAATLGPIRLGLAGKRLRVKDLTTEWELLLLLALAWVALEGRRRLDGALHPREWVALLSFLGLLGYSLTLSPTLRILGTPWGDTLFRWVHDHVPGGAAFRAPGRWSLVFVLPLALLVALGGRAVADRLGGRRATAALLLLLLAALAEYTVYPLPWSRLPPEPPVYRWLAGQPGDFAILELPLAHGDVDAWAMFWGTRHWRYLVNGGGGFPLATWNEIVAASSSSRFDPAAWASAIRSIYPLRYLIVHPDRMPQERRPGWDLIRASPPPGIRAVGQFGPDHHVYEVAGTPESGRDLRRHFSSGLARHRRRVEYALRLAGEDPEVTRWVEVSLNARLLRLDATGGAASVRLDPPLRAADRNEVRFRHRYAVKPEVLGSEAYRIGRTATFAPVDLVVESAGKFQGDRVSVQVNGEEVIPVPRRGYSIVALDARSGQIVAAGSFDTFRSERESRRMAQLVDGLAPGTIVVAAVKHDGGGQLTREGVQALRSVGGHEDLRETLWLSHALIGVKGADPGQAVEAAGSRPLRLAVGRRRPLTITLEEFALR
jgi:hypothetical protein